MESCTGQCIMLRTICEDSQTVAGELVRYRLYEGRFALPQYYAEIVLYGERATAYLGEDREVARELYAALVRGTVTPCTLQAVVDDFL